MNKQAVPLAVRRHQLVATVRKAIGNQDVLVGVSGGADSVALLLLCCAGALQESANYKVAVAHIHHGLRDESDEEQKMVEALCGSLGVQCIATRVTVTPENGSLAAGARKARYEALQTTATVLGFNAVAVAHHAEDQLETMLMALCRGGGLRKLSGIAASRALSDSIDLFRPLLHVEKNELISICNQAQIKWCEDPTNQNSTTPRGRLRQDVIPILRELWNSADRHASNASTMLHAAVDIFDATVPRGNEWDRVTFAKLPLPIIDAALQKAIGECATFGSIQSIRDAIVDSNTEPRTFQLQNGNSATVTSKKVIIHHS